MTLITDIKGNYFNCLCLMGYRCKCTSFWYGDTRGRYLDVIYFKYPVLFPLEQV